MDHRLRLSKFLKMVKIIQYSIEILMENNAKFIKDSGLS